MAEPLRTNTPSPDFNSQGPRNTTAAPPLEPNQEQPDGSQPLESPNDKSVTPQSSEGSSSPEPNSPYAVAGSVLPNAIPADTGQEFRSKRSKPRRADRGKPHRVGHGILSREVRNTLIQLGEDRRTLRRLERYYYEALRPTGRLGDLFFDRFWASYLRLVLIGRTETHAFASRPAENIESLSSALVPGDRPTLVVQQPNGQLDGIIPLAEELPPDVIHQLVLAQRYDRHHSREMYRALAVLLLLRKGGEPALESWAIEMLGVEKNRKED